MNRQLAVAHAPRAGSRRQRGAVLIVAMILLVILTLLGISVMNTTQLEERMASNVQEVNQAFQSAETGLSQAYNNAAVWDLNVVTVVGATAIPSAVGRTDTSSYTVSFISSTGPPPGFDLRQYQTAHFDFQSTGTSQSNFATTLHGGGFRVLRNTGISN